MGHMTIGPRPRTPPLIGQLSLPRAHALVMVHVHGGEDEDDGGGVQLNYRLLIAEEEE